MYIVAPAMPQSSVGDAPGPAGGAPGPVGSQAGALDTPCLVLDLDVLDANIARMAGLARDAGVALRPHAKTHKLVEVARRQLNAGASGLTVAKLGEAELLAAHGIDDLLIAYPVWGAAKWERLARLAQSATIRVAADSLEVFAGMAAAAARRGATVLVRIEVDTGYGRCGVQGPGEALRLATAVDRLPGLSLVGLLSFAGQTYAARGDDAIAAAAGADAARLLEVAAVLRDAGFAVPEISVGSTPSATRVGGLADGITEVRPGTYVFSDRDQAALGWGTLEDCALTARATVVSHPTPTRAIIDAGTKTLSSDRAQTAAGWGVIRGHPDWQLHSLNEEHGILEVPAGQAPIGTAVQIVPNHACGMLNLHDWVAACRGGEVLDWWPVEGRGLIR